MRMGWGASVVALALLAGCESPQAADPSARPSDHETGSYISRVLDERSPRAERHAPSRPTRAAPLFHSPFGDAIAQAPSVHDESSVGGRDLDYWVVGDGPETILILGGIHGDEPSSSELAYDFLAFVTQRPEVIGGRRLVIAPEVNPDGLAAGTRNNGHGVDLNRNFPAGNWTASASMHGHAPGLVPSSEPETRFVLALLRRFPPDRIIAAHAAASCVNWDGPAESLARKMSHECGLPIKSNIGYPTPGSLGSFMGVERAIPTITFELERKDSIAGERDGYRRALLAAVHFPLPAPRVASSGAAEAAARFSRVSRRR